MPPKKFVGCSKSNNKHSLNKARQQLEARNAKCIKRGLFIEAFIFALRLDKLRSADVLYRYEYELCTETPSYPLLYRFPNRYNETIKKGIAIMTAARIIKPANSPGAFPVVNARKKNDSPIFCVDHRAHNRSVKDDQLSIPDINKVLGELQKGKVFTKLDMLARYWQVKPMYVVQEKTTFRCSHGLLQFQVVSFGLMNALSCSDGCRLSTSKTCSL